MGVLFLRQLDDLEATVSSSAQRCLNANLLDRFDGGLQGRRGTETSVGRIEDTGVGRGAGAVAASVPK